jgi:alpha-1,3-glucan synthase
MTDEYRESMTTKHLIQQFKLAIHEALSSKPSVRELMRARSAKQRFPVAQWVEDLETLQSTAIEKHKKHCKRGGVWRFFSSLNFTKSLGAKDSLGGPSESGESSPVDASAPSSDHSLHFGGREGPGHIRIPLYKKKKFQMFGKSSLVSEKNSSSDENKFSTGSDYRIRPAPLIIQKNPQKHPQSSPDDSLDGKGPPSGTLKDGGGSDRTDSPVTPNSGISSPGESSTDDALQSPPLSSGHRGLLDSSLLSIQDIVNEKKAYNLQQVSPFFTDSTGDYANCFEEKLVNLKGKNSEDQLCIEEFLTRSEKDWFNRYRYVKLRKSSPGETPASSIFKVKVQGGSVSSSSSNVNSPVGGSSNEFLLPKNYIPPSGLERLLLRRIGDWPLYSILLALVNQRAILNGR